MGKSPRLGLRSPAQDDEEEYELPAISSTDPLLPSYSDDVESKARATGSASRSSIGHHRGHIRFAPLPSSSGGLSTHAETLRQRRKSRLGRVLLCTWATVVPLFLGLALLGSWVGRDTLTQLRHWDAWDSVPQDVKDWLETVVPVKEEQDLKAFPTDIGYAGPTPTGREAALLATAPFAPMVTPLSPLVPPKSSKKFHIPSHWGNLSPYHSVKSHGLDNASPLIPAGCRLDELHWLQRHGARYPTSAPGGAEDFAARLKEAKSVGEGWEVKGELAWLQDWEYKLGREVLTPFGRSQLYNLGVAARVKYGFLLEGFKGRLPVFRTETQDRMLKSAQNFAAGFFGIPVENQYQLEVQIEAPGFNTTLAPWNMCAKENATEHTWAQKLAEYDDTFTLPARTRLNKLISGYEFTGKDVRSMMDCAAYETVALGYSSFTDLFTKSDWKAYEYRSDLLWTKYASFGQPTARAQGVGWVQELVARLTHTPIASHNSTTNATLHDPVHFPVHDPLYVDFTHDTLFALLLPTMNLTSFASGIDFDAGEELPWDKPPKHHTFIASSIMPFATNMQVQVLTCAGEGADGQQGSDGEGEDDEEDKDERQAEAASAGEDTQEAEGEAGDTDGPEAVESEEAKRKRGWWPFFGSGSDSDSDSDADDNDDDHGESDAASDQDPPAPSSSKHKSPSAAGRYIRIVLNDAVVPLTGINGCEADEDGKCAFDVFVDGMKEVISRVDFGKTCGARQEEGAVAVGEEGADESDGQDLG